MSLPLADNAARILQARLKGMRPADMVIVSLNGPVRTPNPFVVAKPAMAYDWRWARGLDVCIYAKDGDDWPDLAKSIALARPDYLSLWNPDEQWGAKLYLIPTAQDVAKPVSLWKYELDFLPWMDFQNRDFAEGRSYHRDEHGMPQWN